MGASECRLFKVCLSSRMKCDHLRVTEVAGVVPNSAPCQIMHPLVLVGVGEGLSNQVAISTRGCIIWQGCRFRHNTSRARESINGHLYVLQ